MTSTKHSSPWDSDDEDEDRYDDSVGYSEDPDDDEDYQDFLDREFGTRTDGSRSKGGSRLTRLQYATVILLLIVFILPVVLYALAALRP